MTDAALSLTSSLTSLLMKTPVDPTGAGMSATPADPFAALFAAVTGGVAMPITSVTAPIAPLATAPAPPTLAPPTPDTAALALALPAPTEAALPAVIDHDTDADDADTKDKSDDPLGDAIAAGATAVLALPPVIVTPVAVGATTTPIPIPIAIDGPITGKLSSIGAALPRTPAFKPNREGKVDQPAISKPLSDASASATAVTAPIIPSKTDNASQDETEHQNGAKAPPRQADAQPASATLPPETLAAIIATIDQPAASTAPSVSPAQAAAATAIVPVIEPKVATVEQARATPAAPPTAPVSASSRRQTAETAEPRRVSSATRTRIDADAALPLGLATHTAEMPRPASGQADWAVQDKGDAVVQQTLSVAKDGAWLDSLTRDIVASAGSGNDLNFTLDPQHLGSLTVAISQGDDGASIRMTADSDITRNLLLDAQPKLIAEARAQGLKVSDTQVDLKNQNQGSSQDASRWAQGNSGQNGTAQNGQNRQSSPAHQPFVSNLARTPDTETESPSGDSAALYA